MKVVVAIALGLGFLAVWVLTRGRRPRIGEIAPARVLQKKYGLYAENRPEIRLDPAKVPEDLQFLIPMAEKWGIGDDIIRNDFVDKSTIEERRELRDALKEPDERITAWMSSFAELSDEAAAFMFMQIALDETGILMLDEKDTDGKATDP